MRRVLVTTVVAAVAAAAAFVVAAPATAAGSLAVTFLAIGQGDAALYQGPCGDRGLIDLGDGGLEETLAALDRSGGRSLAWVSPSHYDADHLGDLVQLMNVPGVTVGAVFDRGGDRNAKDTATYRTYYDWVSGSGKRRPVDVGSTFALCPGPDAVTFTVVSAGTDGTAAGEVPVTEENDRGLCLEVIYKRFNLATCGDANGTDEGARTDVESRVAPLIGDVEVAKVNHHGSPFSSNQTYVSTLSAQVSVISVGANSYGHPDPGVVARWDSVGDVFQTGNPTGGLRDGDVTVTADGVNALTVTTSASSVSRSYSYDAASSTQRVQGEDRYGTAAAVSQATFAAGVPVAYVATGENFPDALAGAPVAGQDRGPILLVTRDSIPGPTDSELRRLSPGRIVILGGEGAVSAAVASQLAGYTGGGVTRIAGEDRYSTAAAISASKFSPGVTTAYVATGENFPDALAGGAAGGFVGGPVALVTRDFIPDATKAELQRLRPQNITILGGEGAVSRTVEDQLRPYAASAVGRVAGEDRYSTAVGVSSATYSAPRERVYLATGENFPDALAGGPAAAVNAAPLLLVPRDCMPPAVRQEIARLNPSTVVIIGGPGSVGTGAEQQQPCEQQQPPPPPPQGQSNVVFAGVVADPAGDDVQPENGEHVVLRNDGDAAADVGGWYVIDAANNRLNIGAGYTIGPGGELRVYTGPGTNTSTRYYNGRGSAVLNNTGDSLTLYDASGQPVATFSY
jgi:putative cell wall-binding protein/beta-lactamase superfamily II metal-dependent hydrolase